MFYLTEHQKLGNYQLGIISLNCFKDFSIAPKMSDCTICLELKSKFLVEIKKKLKEIKFV